MKPVEILKPPIIENEKGSTLEWCKGKPGMQVTVYRRTKNTVFAQHYHSGKDPSKNPELFLLIEGRVEFLYIDPETDKKHSYIIEPFTEVRVQPQVKHQVRALEDSLFIEYRAQAFDPENPDTFPVEPEQFI